MIDESDVAQSAGKILASLIAGAIGAWVAFRLQVERFFGKDAEREKHYDERHREILRRLDNIEHLIHQRGKRHEQ